MNQDRNWDGVSSQHHWSWRRIFATHQNEHETSMAINWLSPLTMSAPNSEKRVRVGHCEGRLYCWDDRPEQLGAEQVHFLKAPSDEAGLRPVSPNEPKLLWT